MADFVVCSKSYALTEEIIAGLAEDWGVDRYHILCNVCRKPMFVGDRIDIYFPNFEDYNRHTNCLPAAGSADLSGEADEGRNTGRAVEEQRGDQGE